MPNVSHNQEKAILQKQLNAALDKLDEADAMAIKKMDPRFVAPEPEQFDPNDLSIAQLESELAEMFYNEELTAEMVNELIHLEENGKDRAGAHDILSDYLEKVSG